MTERFADRRPSDPRERSVTAWLDCKFDEEQIWADLTPGPSAAELSARLSAMPREFLDERVDATALVGDVLAAGEDRLSGDLASALRLVAKYGAPGASIGVAVGVWLYASEELLGPLSRPLSRSHAPRLLLALGLRQAAVVEPYLWLVAAEQREETARAVLLWSGQLPEGELPAVARSRWTALDSLGRDDALRAAMEDFRHRAEVMRRLADQRAREAAARYTHE